MGDRCVPLIGELGVEEPDTMAEHSAAAMIVDVEEVFTLRKELG